MDNVGGIYYDVEFKTGELINGQRQIQKTLDTTEKAADGTTAAFSRMKAAAIAVSSALAVQRVISYADAWATAGNKLANSAKAGETAAGVLDMIFESSQRTRSSLDTTTTMYSRLEAATRSMGIGSKELLGITETINKAFAVSGAAVSEVAGASIQLSQALGEGALRGEEFNSVNSAAPRIMEAVAKAMGEERGALKALAAEGKITTEIIMKALTGAASSIDKEFANMTATFAQNLQIVQNNITQFIGSSSVVQSGVSGLGNAFVRLSENIDTVATAAGFAAAIVGARLVGAFQTTTTEAIRAALAANQKAAADLNAATGAARHAEAAKLSAKAAFDAAAANEAAAIATANAAKANLALLTSARNAAIAQAEQATAARGAAMAEYAAATATAAKAQTAFKTASDAATISVRASNVAISAMQGAFALLGGPTGVILLAAYAIYTFYQRAQEAKAEALAFGSQIDKLAQSFRDLSQAQALGKAAETAQFIRAQRAEIEQLDKALKKAGFEYAELNRQGMDTASARVAEEMAILTAKRETSQKELNKAIALESDLRKAAAGTLQDEISEGADSKGSAPGAPAAPEKAKGAKFDSAAYIEELRKRASFEREQIEVVKQAELRKNEELLASGKITAQQAADARVLILTEAFNKTRELLISQAAEEVAIEQQKQAQLAAARAQAQAVINSTASPEDQVIIRREEQIARMDELRARDLENEQIYLDAITAIRAKADADLAKLEEERVKTAEDKAKLERAAVVSGFESSAAVVKAFAGEQSKEYKAMLVASKAYALTEASVHQGIAVAKAVSAGDYWTAAIRVAGVITQFAGIYRSINSAGGRLYGGPAEAGSMYRVNENGAPEMFTAKNGQQYMMPTSSGQVTPANKIGGGGVSVVINNYAGADVQATSSDDGRTVEIAVRQAKAAVANDLRTNSGEVWAAARAGTNIQGRID